MSTRALAVATAVLVAIVVYQQVRIVRLRAEVQETQRRVLEARSLVIESMDGERDDIRRAMMWLNDFYKAPEGLQRRDGLWIDGHPDYDALSFWIFDVYLRRRLKGDPEGEVRSAIESAIRSSDEWRVRHGVRG